MMKTQPRRLAKEAGFFFIANLAAGLLNYLYQVSASKQLSRSEFADISSWLAHVSVFLLFAGILQYAGNFFPANQRNLRRQILFINAAALSMIGLALSLTGIEPIAIGALTVVVGLATGWVTGQAQFRLLFNLLGIVNILSALTKLLLVILPNSPLSLMDRYYSAILFGSVPALWLLSAVLWSNSSETPVKQNSRHLWLAPVILSIATAIIPQFDLVVLRRSLSADVFEEFARASLFYKGVFFLFMIGAQWLLPRQILAKEKPGHPALTSAWLIPISLGGSTVMTAIAPPLAVYALGWSSAPPLEMIFLSCLNMCLLTWLFLLIQECCAKERTRTAGLALLGIALEVTLQLVFKLPIHTYLGLALLIQSVTVYWLVNQLKNRHH